MSPTIEISNEDREKVLAGATLLDARKPDWWKTIDLPDLQTAGNDTCVLAQAFQTSYWDALEQLFPDLATQQNALPDEQQQGALDREASKYGFSIDTRIHNPHGAQAVRVWDGLDAAWRELIENRRLAAS